MQLLHNPRCSKSRAVKEWLDEQGVSYDERDYLQQPLDHHELTALVAAVSGNPASLVRETEAEWDLPSPQHLTAAELIAALVARPSCLQRPIVWIGQVALIARPPELLAGWLQQQGLKE